MTCSKCDNALHEDATNCPFCDAPVESINGQQPISKTDQELHSGTLPGALGDTTSQCSRESDTPAASRSKNDVPPEQPILWNPIVIAILEIPLLGPLCASGLIALNWRKLNRPKMARFAWCVGLTMTAALLVTSITLAHMGREQPSTLVWSICSFSIWFLALALPQILFVRKHVRIGYTKRRWIVPIGVGIGIGLLVPIAFEKLEAALDPFSAAQTDVTLTPTQVAKQAGRHVFPVHIRWVEDASFLLIFTQPKECRASGSAVALSGESGVMNLVTNRHVVTAPSGARDIVRTIGFNGVELPFDVVAVGKSDLDMVLIRVQSPHANEVFTTPVQLRNQLSIGDGCVAIGNTLGEGVSITSGIISRFDDWGTNVMIRTSAPISPGNSGGGLFSLNGGALIGITTASSLAGTAQNVNYAIPMDYIVDVGLWEMVSPPSS
jgi:hypothetical protein